MKQKLILFIKQKLSRIAAYIRGDLIAHYIGGGDMLPPPLTHEEEAELLAALSDSGRAEGAKKTLIERNLRLVVYIAKKFENTGVGVEDLISIGTIGLIKAISSLRPMRRGALKTKFLCICAKTAQTAPTFPLTSL